MRVDLLVPDAPAATAQRAGGDGGFGRLLDAAGAFLERADNAEARFTAHRGGLQEMVVERARADIALAVAAAAAQRGAQALNTLLGMQV